MSDPECLCRVGKQACMPRGSAEEMRVTVVNLAPNSPTAPSHILSAAKVAFAHVTFVRITVFACGNARTRGRGWIEEGLAKTQRRKDLLLRKLRKRMTGKLL